MHRLLLCAAVIAVSPLTSSADHQRRFPYEAVIEGAEAYARSGPGRNYYPTAKIKHGETVTVHRHDPGGWYMISPPPGSFSWIRAKYVKKESANRGVLIENSVVVRVGSDFGDDRDIEQVRLSTGDVVEILGSQTVRTRFGDALMYKIVPPRGEYRWISGRFCVPRGGIAKKINDRDPYQIPSQVKRDKGGSHEIGHPITHSGPKLMGPGGNDSHLHGKHGDHHHHHDAHDEDRDRLAQLDAQFRTMIDGSAANWRFRDLETAYLKLKADTSHAIVAHKIDRRLETIAHYRTIRGEYLKMIRLTSRIERRDAELASGGTEFPIHEDHEHGVHHHHGRHHTPQDVVVQEDGGQISGPILRAPGNPVPPPADLPNPVHTRRRISPPIPGQNHTPMQPHTAHRQGPQQIPNFDGAGIIRQVRPTQPGMPQYGLFAPDGRLLAYLNPVRGLPMHRYVNQPMGVFGQRTHLPRWNSDYIVVRAMMPVRLMPSR